MFNHGDKVTCKIARREITDAKISINNDGKCFICQNEKDGAIADNLFGYRYSWGVSKDFTNMFLSDLKPTRTSGKDLIKLDLRN